MSTDENRKWWPAGEYRSDTEFAKTGQERPDRSPDVDDGADNSLDELDTLLQEINIEDSSGAGNPWPSGNRTGDATTASDANRFPLIDTELEKLVSDLANESGFEDDVSTRSLARKLAPPNAPDKAQGDDPDQAAGTTSATDASEGQDEPRRRRLRLRPVWRVQGHQAQIEPAPAGNFDAPLLTQQVRGAALGAGATMLLFAAAIAAFSFVGPLNRLLPDRSVMVSDNAETPDRSGDADDAGQNVSVQTDQPAMDIAAGLTGTASPDKSDERIVQDSVVQAVLKDPEKRALNPDNETGIEVRQPEFDADPVTTGSITRSDSAGVSEMTRNDLAANPDSDASAVKPDDVNASVEPSVSVDDAGAHAPGLPATKPTMPVSAQQAARLDEAGPVEKRPQSMVDRLLARAHQLLQAGDIAPARRLFHRVVAMGDSRGAKGVGMTYDPEIYKTLPVIGLTPDSGQAEAWYRKARELSSKEVVYGETKTEAAPDLQN